MCIVAEQELLRVLRGFFRASAIQHWQVEPSQNIATFIMSERSAQLAELQGMGFHPAACARALQVTNNSLNRAIDWLLSNPDEAAAAASGAAPQLTIFSMGFDESLARRALEQAGGNEQRAITMILNGEVRESPSREPSPPPTLLPPAALQPAAQHTGEFRRTSARPPVRVGLDGSILGEIERYCGAPGDTGRFDGMSCAHGAVIQGDHWSCESPLPQTLKQSASHHQPSF